MIQNCPNCKTQIMETLSNGQVTGVPFGNYRRIRFELENGSSTVIPLCSTCYDKMDDESELEKLKTNMVAHLITAYPKDWSEAQRIKYANEFSKPKKILVKLGNIKQAEFGEYRMCL